MQRDLPDFDTLMQMAKSDPEQLNALRAAVIKETINAAKPELQQRLKGLQFTIDMEIERSPNAYVSCMKLSSLMHDSMGRLRSFFDKNGTIQDIRGTNDDSAKVICFEKSKSKLRA